MRNDVKMDKNKARRITITLFLLAIFLFLVIYIAAWVMDIFESTKITAEGGAEENPVFSCVGLVFDVQEETLSYDGTTLRFSVINKKFSEGSIPKLTIMSGEDRKEIPMKAFLPGKIKDVEVDIELSDMLTVYPTGCEMYAKKFEIE